MTRLRIIAEFDIDLISPRGRENFNTAVQRIIPGSFGIPGTLVYLATEQVVLPSPHAISDGDFETVGRDRTEFEP